MTAPRTPKRAAILEAALRLFSQYGYRRTSIDDIAREAEIAKGTVYLSFKSKEEIFRALCESLIERVDSAVNAARTLDTTVEERLTAMLEAKFGLYYETVRRSAHAAELMDSKNRLSADLFDKADRRYMKKMRDTVEQAARRGELAPRAMGVDAGDVAELLVAAAQGIEGSAPTSTAFHRKLRDAARVIVAGLSAGLSAHPGRGRGLGGAPAHSR